MNEPPPWMQFVTHATAVRQLGLAMQFWNWSQQLIAMQSLQGWPFVGHNDAPQTPFEH